MPENLHPAQEDAYQLVETALLLDASRGDQTRLAVALERNLRLWIGVATLVDSPNVVMDGGVRENMKRLAHFVSSKILKEGVAIAEESLDTLININLQISEGLLSSVAPTSRVKG